MPRSSRGFSPHPGEATWWSVSLCPPLSLHLFSGPHALGRWWILGSVCLGRVTSFLGGIFIFLLDQLKSSVHFHLKFAWHPVALASRPEVCTLCITSRRTSGLFRSGMKKNTKFLVSRPLLKPCWAPFWLLHVLLGPAVLQPLYNGAPVFISRPSASEAGVSASPASSVVSSSTAPSPLHTLQSRLVAASPSSSLPGTWGTASRPPSRVWAAVGGWSWQSSLVLNPEDVPQISGLSGKFDKKLELASRGMKFLALIFTMSKHHSLQAVHSIL